MVLAKTKKMLIWTMSSLFLFCSSLLAIAEEAGSEATYMQKLQYEYRNRAMTHIGMQAVARYSRNSEKASFYQAYYELEETSRGIYAHASRYHGVDYEANRFTELALSLLMRIGWRFISPEYLESLVDPYMSELEEMKSLSAPELAWFFDYVIAQENAQLIASRAALGGAWDEGAGAFEAFLPQAKSLLTALDSGTVPDVSSSP